MGFSQGFSQRHKTTFDSKPAQRLLLLYAMNTFENHINDCLVAGDGDDISLSSVGPPSEHVTGDAAAYHPTYCVVC